MPPISDLSSPPPPPRPPATPFVHTGAVSELLAIGLVNLLLKVLTLGAFHFWAKTRVRRYVWSHTRFAEEAFEYTGRGLELALGYIVAMVALIGLGAALQVPMRFAERVPATAIGASALSYGAFVYLAGFASFSARRYLLSRTRWRSIRFALTGRARDHAGLFLLGSVLTLLTLGFYLPTMRNRLAAHLVGNAWFGSERFRYDGRAEVLRRRFLAAGALAVGIVLAWGVLLAAALPFVMRFLRVPELPGTPIWLPALMLLAALVLLVLLVPSLATAWLWYRAGELRHFVAHTRLGEARFALELPTRRYLWLYAGNIAALALTAGLAYPWVVVRTARTLTRHLRMDGVLELEAIEQASAHLPSTGEGLADALDLGSI